jgi:hypothetical protein
MKQQLLALAVTAGAITSPAANASQLIDRNATGVKLEINASGEALLTYKAAGTLRHVLAGGAVNALAPTTSRPQFAFKLTYGSGGKQALGRPFPNVCAAYDGPALAWMVTACKAPDGSYWALQSWQRELPDYGVAPKGAQASWELRLSHWTGALAVLDVHVDWTYKKYDEVFGTYTYAGTPVHGFKSTRYGVPLDTFGRNLYLDTYGSAYGAGWRRENSFLAHKPTGAFCYGFFPHPGGRIGKGAKYRLTVSGPGVTPDVMWQGAAPGPYDATADAAANEQIKAMNDRLCRPN